MLFDSKELHCPRKVIKQLRQASFKARRRLKKGDWYVTIEEKAARLIEAYLEGCNIKSVKHAEELLESEREAWQGDVKFWRNTTLITFLVFGFYVGLTLPLHGLVQ